MIFSADAFHENVFIFTGRMKPHSLAGTPGAEVVDELDRGDRDCWLPKPRFSAFFGTHLDQGLRERNVTICAVAGIAINFCVLTTVLDALCDDFKGILLEECTAASSEAIHAQTLDIYRKNPLFPLFCVNTSNEIITVLERGADSPSPPF